MRIHRLKLNNLGSYADAEITFADRVTLVGGPNGAGKTTIRRALELALTGGCDLSESGQGLDGLRRQGSRRKWAIEIEGTTREGETFMFPRGEGEGPRAEIQKLADKYLGGIPAHHVRACLRAGELVYGTDKAAQKIVLELCDPGVSIPASLVTAAAKHGITLGATASIAELNAAEKKARADRTVAGRLVDSLKAATPERPTDVPESAAGMTLQQLDEQVTNGTRKLGELRTERDGVLKKITKTEAAPEKAATALSEARTALAALPAEEVDLDTLAARLRKWEDDRSEAIEARRIAGERIAKAEEAFAIADARRKLAQEEINRLASIADCCPTCTRTLAAGDVERLLIPLRKKLKQLVTAAEKAAEDLTSAQGARDILPDPIAIGETIRAHVERMDALRAREDRRLELAGTIADLEARVAEIEATNEAELAALRGKADELGEKIARVETLAQQLSRYAGARHAAEKSAAHRREAETTHDELDALVKKLGPDGIRKDAGGAGLDDLQAAINAVTEPMGFAIDLGPVARLEGPLMVNGRPAKLLSSSEQVRVGVGIQAAIARFSGLGLVVIDDVDRCLGVPRQRLQDAVRAIGEDLQVVILLAIKNEVVDGVNVFVSLAPRMAAAYGWDVWATMPAASGSTLERVGAAESEAA